MSENTAPKPADEEAPTPAAGQEEPAEKKPEDDKAHPHPHHHEHHKHMVIEAPSTGVAHVEPGGVIFP